MSRKPRSADGWVRIPSDLYRFGTVKPGMGNCLLRQDQELRGVGPTAGSVSFRLEG